MTKIGEAVNAMGKELKHGDREKNISKFTWLAPLSGQTSKQRQHRKAIAMLGDARYAQLVP